MIDWFEILTRGVIPLVGAAWLLVLQMRASNREKRLARFMAGGWRYVNGSEEQT